MDGDGWLPLGSNKPAARVGRRLWGFADVVKERLWTPAFAAVLLAWLLAAGPARADHSVVEHVSQGAIGGNANLGASFNLAARDGSVGVFRSSEQLVSADTDGFVDIYRREGGVT